MRKIDYLIALLERIAFNTQHGNLEFQDYLERTIKANAVTERNEVQDETREKRREDQISIRQGQQPGNRGKKHGDRGYSRP